MSCFTACHRNVIEVLDSPEVKQEAFVNEGELVVLLLLYYIARTIGSDPYT